MLRNIELNLRFIHFKLKNISAHGITTHPTCIAKSYAHVCRKDTNHLTTVTEVMPMSEVLRITSAIKTPDLGDSIRIAP